MIRWGHIRWRSIPGYQKPQPNGRGFRALQGRGGQPTWRNPDGHNPTDTRDYPTIGRNSANSPATEPEDNAKHSYTTAHDAPHKAQTATTSNTETTTDYPTSSGYAAGTTE